MKSLSLTIFRDRYHQETGTWCEPRKAEKPQLSHPAPLLQTSLEGNKDLTQLRGRLYPSPQSNCVESSNSHEAAMTCQLLVILLKSSAHLLFLPCRFNSFPVAHAQTTFSRDVQSAMQLLHRRDKALTPYTA